MSLSALGNVSYVQFPCRNYRKIANQFNAAPPALVVANAQPHFERAASHFLPENQSVAAIVFGDGSPSRLYPLTKRRSEGAIPIAGNYRLIDAVVSNCINSSISKIYAITQFNSTSLNSHLSRAYSGGLSPGQDGFLEVIAACQTPEEKGWFQGTADAIRRCLWILEEHPCVEFLILPGHHLYKMDYQKLIEAHRSNRTDITLAVLSEMRDDDPGFGFAKINTGLQVTEFLEEPSDLELLSAQNSVASNESIHPGMGIYVINKYVMIDLLKRCFPTANDLRCDVIPRAMSLGMKVHAYIFDGYWEDMRSIGAFYHANMKFIEKRDTASAHDYFYDTDTPLYTLPRRLPPTMIADAVIIDSVVGDGCYLDRIQSRDVPSTASFRCNIKRSVIGMRTRIEQGARVEDSIIMGSDAYPKGKDDEEACVNGVVRNIPVGIGEGSYIRKAIVDKNAKIGKNVMIINKDEVQEGSREADGYVIRGGIVVIVNGAVIRDGSIL